MNQTNQELRNRYLSDPAIIRMNEEIAKAYNSAIPKIIMDSEGKVFTSFDERIEKHIEFIRQSGAMYIAQVYPELVYRDKPVSEYEIEPISMEQDENTKYLISQQVKGEELIANALMIPADKMGKAKQTLK